ncbi:MAG: lytic murein transglycosylase [Candidatus Kapabacteria bacterium]|nr:lytic murein transglycosylase [Candidatus Kapabacteria bacterium]
MSVRLSIALSIAAVVAAAGLLYSLQRDKTFSWQHDQPQDSTAALERAMKVIASAGGVDTTFVRSLITSPQTRFDSALVSIIVTNFASKPDYSHNYNAYSVKQVRQFLINNATVLAQAEQLYNVPAEAIAAILWVETKHGRYTGKHHIPSVYLSVALSAEPDFIERNVERVVTGPGADTLSRDSIRALVERKAEKKVRWAISQLQALEHIAKEGTLDVHRLRGSWAGAFGLSQFLPSSYRSWAVDGDADGDIDLYSTSDAIFSVANYLQKNGWGTTEADQRKAVFHYNNSTAYVDAVLRLTFLAKQP